MSHAETSRSPQRSLRTAPALAVSAETSTLEMRLPRVERVSPHLLRVYTSEATVGFVERVGPVFVALAGERYDRAVEVGQYRELEPAAQKVFAQLD